MRGFHREENGIPTVKNATAMGISARIVDTNCIQTSMEAKQTVSYEPMASVTRKSISSERKEPMGRIYRDVNLKQLTHPQQLCK
jgi:hypothetical protein